MTDKIVVCVHCAGVEEAKVLAHALLDRRLISCATIGAPVTSLYPWKGKREEGTEIPLVLKTRQAHWPALEAEVRRLHSYEVPEILALPVLAGNPGYLAWIDEVTSRGEVGASGVTFP